MKWAFKCTPILVTAATLCAQSIPGLDIPTPFDRAPILAIPSQITPIGDLDPAKPERLTAEAIDRAQSVIVFSQPTIRSRPILEALLRAKDRGIFICGIIDPDQSNSQQVIAFLRDSRMSVLLWQGGVEVPQPYFAVIDYQTVLLGQYNWALRDVALPLIRIQEMGTGSYYHNQWVTLAEHSLFPESE